MAVSFVDSGTTAFEPEMSSFVWTVPAGTVEGDFFIIAVTCGDDNPGDMSTNASGMELLFPYAYTSGASVHATVWQWFAPASPPASVTFTPPFNIDASIGWMRFRGVDPDQPLAGGPEVDSWSSVSTSFTAPSLTTTADGAYVVGGLNIPSGSRSVSFPSGWTNRAVGTVRIGALGTLGEIPSAGNVGSANWSITGGSMRGQAWQAALRSNGASAAPAGTLDYSWMGVPTSSSVTVSARTANTESVRLKVGTNSSVTSGVVFSDPVDPDSAGWCKVTATGLSPNTQYWYQVEMTNADDDASLSTEFGAFKTLPTVGAQHSFSFAFGSCHDSNSSNGAAFGRIVNRAPDLFFHLGDFHYADSTSTAASSHRVHMQGQIEQNTGLRNLLASVPTHYTKSDHDVGGGNGVLPGPWTAPNLSAYKQIVPHLPLEVSDSIYLSFVVGRVRFICTDHRYLRTTTSMMGTTQKNWFKEQLLESEPVKIWVQDSPWTNHDSPEDPEDGGDKWSDYPDEHEELGDYIAEFAVGQVVGIHGDMHALAADDGSNNDWGGFPTFNAAPFDRNNSVKGGPWSEGVYPPTASQTFRQQYGMVTVTDTGDDITVSYVGYDSSNNDQIDLSVFVDTSVEVDEGSTSIAVQTSATVAGETPTPTVPEGESSLVTETVTSLVGVMPTATVGSSSTSIATQTSASVSGETPTATVPEGGASLVTETGASVSGVTPTGVPYGGASLTMVTAVAMTGVVPAGPAQGSASLDLATTVTVSGREPGVVRGIRIVNLSGPRQGRDPRVDGVDSARAVSGSAV